MAGEHEVSHGDILHKLGVLEGKLDTMHQTMGLNRSDIGEAFRRLGLAEQRIAQGVILAVVLSVIMPIIVAMLSPRVEFGPDQPAPTHPSRTIP
jgi:hypothetical protein